MMQNLTLFSIAYKKRAILSLLTALLCICCPSHAIDLNPFDIVAPSPDKTFFSAAMLNSELEGPYTGGGKSSPLVTLSRNQIQLQLGRTYRLGGYTGISYCQLPVGMLQPGGATSNAPTDYGLGDMTIATALWPYANSQTRTYVGIGGFLTLPTGSI